MDIVDERRFNRRLFYAGKQLEHRPSWSNNKLLQALEKVESQLSMVKNKPSTSILRAMLPAQNSLVKPQLMRHQDKHVTLLVMNCLSQISRITAPNIPYNDDLMKEILELIFGSFQELGDMNSRSFEKRFAILKIVAEVRLCAMMLDLGLNDRLLVMFRHFFSNVSQNSYSANVYEYMKTIMCLVLDESADISQELLSVLLVNLRREIKVSSPAAHSLSLNVVASCAEKLRPHLRAKFSSDESITCKCLHGYPEIVHDIFFHGREINANQYATASQDFISFNGSCIEPAASSCVDSSNSPATNSELFADYPHNEWVSDEKNNDKRKRNEADHEFLSSREGGQGRPTKLSRVREELNSVAQGIGIVGVKTGSNGLSLKKYTPSKSNSNLGFSKSLNRNRSPSASARKKSTVSAMETPVKGSGEDEKLIGQKIKVWWPADKQFYEGTVESYDLKSKKHTILYFDGDREELHLCRQRWDFINNISRPESHSNLVLSKSLNRNMPPRKNKSVSADTTVKGSGDNEKLVGRKIKVWWPADKQFYEGIVESYDPKSKKHAILYFDGDHEELQLCRQRWDFIENMV